jgi:hypothetical protein
MPRVSRESDAKRGGADGPQRDAAPGEGKLGGAITPGVDREDMERGVEKCGVKGEARGFGRKVVGQRDLGKNLAVSSVDGLQSSEAFAIVKAALCESVIDSVDVELGGAGHRPVAKVVRVCFGWGLCREEA